MRRHPVVLLVALVGLAACGSAGPRSYPLAKELAVRLEHAGLCEHPRLNHHRRREVLCAPRPGGGRTGVATFVSHRSAVHSIQLARDRARFIGCDLHAANGTLTFVIGPRFVVVGSDRPAAVARVLHADVVDPPATCRPDDDGSP
jgi:predicted small lipoprotein YifL